MQNPARRIQKGTVEARTWKLARDVLRRETLQEMGRIVAAERDEAASGESGAGGGWRGKRVRRGVSSISTE